MQNSQDRKYLILLNILDKYVAEGSLVRRRKSQFDTSTEEKQNQARSRAFIHLYLASTYGVLYFEERENIITDASNDGGIDAYYIDKDQRIIDIIQSKFRVGSSNFESKYINPEEISAVDVDRIMKGNTEDILGNRYNGHILAFIEKISKIPDIVRFKTKVTILANVKNEQYQLVEKLFSGDITNILNFERCYAELVLPAVRGEQHYTSSLSLHIDLSNKSNNSVLSAEIPTAHGPSQLTVVLVPTLEIAKIINKYRNSILRYNPRSYLEFKEQRTNEGIKKSIVEIDTGEFAILNNGITIVSDETHVNHRVGAKNKAQVLILNPQIINGGQTAYTLGRILQEADEKTREKIFNGKEVVLRIITLPEIHEDLKKELIISISFATNSQTTVSSIDRTASNDENRATAEKVFRKTGLLYEFKRGEYADALKNGFIDRNIIIERVLFTRIMNIACQRYSLGLDKRMMRNTGGIIGPHVDDAAVDRFYKLYKIYKTISKSIGHGAIETVAKNLSFSVFVFIYCEKNSIILEEENLSNIIKSLTTLYADFCGWAQNDVEGFTKTKIDRKTLAKTDTFAMDRWKKSKRFVSDAEKFIKVNLVHGGSV